MVDVTDIFVDYLARNRGPVADNPLAREPPHYGVSARLAGSTIELGLTFRAGCAYCCCLWGCHLPFVEGRRWEWLRGPFAERGITVMEPLILRIDVVIEAGSLFFDLVTPIPGQRGRYPLSQADESRYEGVATEAGPRRIFPL